jgi:ADP-ribosyl-[dinitrogen reductase] hydrolase
MIAPAHKISLSEQSQSKRALPTSRIECGWRRSHYFYSDQPVEAVSRAADSSRTTHGAAECVDACRYMAGLLIGALQGASKSHLLGDLFEPMTGIWKEKPLAPAIQDVASGSFRAKQPPAIQGSGYVVRSLEAALWAFYHSHSFEDAVLRAVNLGDDADTTGAICGQIAGAYYGVEGIPARWRSVIRHRDLIETFAVKLIRA